MNEIEWQTGTDSRPMLDYLEGRASDRKLRLFACACVRRYWSRLQASNAYRTAVTTAERFADDLVGQGELQQARERAQMLAGGAPGFDALACLAAAHTVDEDAMEAARNVVENTQRQAVRDSAEDSAFPHEEADRNAAASAAELQAQADLLREIIGNPFRPARLEHAWVRWNNGTVVALAREILEEGRFQEMPYLADALLDAGCTNEAVLRHCQQTTGHVRGCWVLDLILGGE